MANLLIKEAEIKHIDALLGEIPLKYGIQLANYFSYLYQLRDKEAAASVVKGVESLPGISDAKVATLKQ